MKQIPIIFSSEMVRALLNGTKTQTRRLNGLKEINKNPNNVEFERYQKYPDGSLRAIFWERSSDECGSVKAPCQSGDLIYVREAWRLNSLTVFIGKKYEYRASSEHADRFSWQPSIHLPKEASRIWLRVTDVTVERLQDISEADALAEGIDRSKCSGDWNCPPSEVFMELWTKINSKESLDTNPFVWKITFEVVSTTGRAGISEKKLVTV